MKIMLANRKVQVGKDQEKAQSEKSFPLQKPRREKKTNQQSSTYTMIHFVSRMSSYFPNRWPLSYLNSTKNMKTYIRRFSFAPELVSYSAPRDLHRRAAY